MKRPLVVVGLLMALVIQVGSFIAAYQSNTFDEPYFISEGVAYVQTGRFDVDQFCHPPFQKYLMGLSVQSLSPTVPTQSENYKGNNVFRLGPEFVYKNTVTPEKIIVMGRLPSLFLSLLLAAFVFIWARRWFGELGGILALTAYVFEPNIVAHSGIASMDIGVTAFMFIACYFLTVFVEEENKSALVASGVAAGLAITTKLSGLFILVWCTILLLVATVFPYGSLQKKKGKEIVRKVVLPLLAIVGIAAAVILVVYQGRFIGRFFMLIGVMIDIVFGHAAIQNFPNFFHGHHRVGGWWYYFIGAFLIKTPLPWLLLIGMAAVRVTKERKLSIFLIILSFLLVCTFAQKQDGLRYFLPAFPFFCLFIGGVATAMTSRPTLKWAAMGLCVWLVFEAGMICPNYLTYFNQLVGGPRHGYKWLVDSNLDWGQNLVQVRNFVSDHGNPEIIVACFGTAYRDHFFGPHQDLIADTNNIDKNFKHINSSLPEREWLIVSATLLQGYGLSDPNAFSWLRQRTALAQIANSTFIYDVTNDAESQFKIGEIYFRNKQKDFADRQLTRANGIISRYKTAGKLTSERPPSLPRQ